jgi:ClpP class serine protease
MKSKLKNQKDNLKYGVHRMLTVKQNRKGKISEDSDVYRGRLYEGEDIVKEGLADGFGTLYDALELASGMAMMRKG